MLTGEMSALQDKPGLIRVENRVFDQDHLQILREETESYLAASFLNTEKLS